MCAEHIVRSFSLDLQHLADLVIRMGGVVEAQVDAAVTAVARSDARLARQVVEADQRIDEYEQSISTEVVRLLAQRQPLAQDLREVLSAMKISSDLERIGDYAANIAKRSLVLVQMPVVQPVAAIPRMGRWIKETIKYVLEAYSEGDIGKAITAWKRDEELDDLYSSLFREVLTYMMENPRNITPCTHLLFMAKNMERIGDHLSNIAETVHFMKVGIPLPLERPRNDASNYCVVPQETEPKLPLDDRTASEGTEHAA